MFRGTRGRYKAQIAREARQEFLSNSPYALLIQQNVRAYISRLHHTKISKSIREMYIIRKQGTMIAVVIMILIEMIIMMMILVMIIVIVMTMMMMMMIILVMMMIVMIMMIMMMIVIMTIIPVMMMMIIYHQYHYRQYYYYRGTQWMHCPHSVNYSEEARLVNK